MACVALREQIFCAIKLLTTDMKRKFMSLSSHGSSQQHFRKIHSYVDRLQQNTTHWMSLVDPDKLSSLEKKIHERHINAIQDEKETYTDPKTGYSVITRLTHLQRGDCCGNQCRHCPYGHSNVPENMKKKTYNSAFYI